MVAALGAIGDLDRALCRKAAEERFSARRMIDQLIAVSRPIRETRRKAGRWRARFANS
jgi:hypothetical protein